MEEIPQEAYNRQQIVELAKSDMDMLGGLALPEIFTLLFPPIFKAMWQLLLDSTHKKEDFSQIALGLPRGFAKTAVIKLYGLYCVLFSSKKFILITASNQRKAEAIVADICYLLNSPNIKALFGNWQANIDIDRQDLKKFTFAGKTMILAALGAGGDPRGLNIEFVRPDVIICDDVQSRENALSTVQAEALRGWLFSTLLKTKSPFGCLTIYIGNMFASEDCILKELKYNPDWVSFIAGAILQDGESLWPELYPVSKLMTELERDVRANNAHIFFSEILNDDTTASITGFDPALLLKWNPLNNQEICQGKFIIIDPSGQSLNSDPTVISLFELWDGVPWLRVLDRGTFSPKQTIEAALLMGAQHQCDLIIVENVAYQASLLFWFTEVAKMAGLEGYQFLPINRGGASKNAAILTTLRQLQNKEIGIHPDCLAAVLHDIAIWNPQRTKNVDDLLDVIAYAPLAVLKYQPLMGRTINAAFEDSADLRIRSTLENCPI